MKTKVVKIYEPGSVDVLKIEEVEIDKPSLNEVLIEHSYAGLNFIDINHKFYLQDFDSRVRLRFYNEYQYYPSSQ